MPSADALIAAVASRQHGRVTRVQLARAGLTRREIDGRIARGALIPCHNGVYAVGHQSRHLLADASAAVLACGADAILTGRHAAALHGFRPLAAHEANDVDIAVPRRVRRAGITPLRRAVPPGQRTSHHGLPIVTPARAAFDLAYLLDDARDIHRAIREVQVLRLAQRPALIAVAESAPKAKGSALFAAALGLLGDAPTKSWANDRMHAMLSEAAVPSYSRDKRVEGKEWDFVWWRLRLIVEIDSYAFHHDAWAHSHDHRSDTRVEARGWTVKRIHVIEVQHQPYAAFARALRAISACEARAATALPEGLAA